MQQKKKKKKKKSKKKRRKKKKRSKKKKKKRSKKKKKKGKKKKKKRPIDSSITEEEPQEPKKVPSGLTRPPNIVRNPKWKKVGVPTTAGCRPFSSFKSGASAGLKLPPLGLGFSLDGKPGDVAELFKTYMWQNSTDIFLIKY